MWRGGGGGWGGFRIDTALSRVKLSLYDKGHLNIYNIYIYIYIIKDDGRGIFRTIAST